MLYSDRYVSVSPSWVRFGKTSYTVRSIVSLEFEKHQTPQLAKYTLLLVSLVLLGFSLLHVSRGTLTEWIALPALVASIGLFLVAFWLAFISRAQYEITLSMVDGSVVTHQRSAAQAAYDIHEAIRDAVENADADEEDNEEGNSDAWTSDTGDAEFEFEPADNGVDEATRRMTIIRTNRDAANS